MENQLDKTLSYIQSGNTKDLVCFILCAMCFKAKKKEQKKCTLEKKLHHNGKTVISNNFKIEYSFVLYHSPC